MNNKDNNENLSHKKVSFQQCQNLLSLEKNRRKELSGIVDAIWESCKNQDHTFEHANATSVPSRSSIIDTINLFLKLIFPGFYTQESIASENLKYFLGMWTSELNDILSEQISRSIMHDCLRYNKECIDCLELGQDAAIDMLRKIPDLRKTLGKDVKAAFKNDPAAKSFDEIVFSYPGLLAITIYRIAHILFKKNIPIIPRMMTEYAHSATGIDIHPGAEIDEYFFIDHGTGVVIGETSQIGKNVTIYQGVTIGALNFARDESGTIIKGKKRHPTIEDDVIIYAGATILGGETVVGKGCIIGGNVWLTSSVSADTTVIMEQKALIYKNQNDSK